MVDRLSLTVECKRLEALASADRKIGEEDSLLCVQNEWYAGVKGEVEAQQEKRLSRTQVQTSNWRLSFGRIRS